MLCAYANAQPDNRNTAANKAAIDFFMLYFLLGLDATPHKMMETRSHFRFQHERPWFHFAITIELADALTALHRFPPVLNVCEFTGIRMTCLLVHWPLIVVMVVDAPVTP